MSTTSTPTQKDAAFETARILSPRRKTTHATNTDGLAIEQLEHFGIAADSDFGRELYEVARRLYQTQHHVNQLWEITNQTLNSLDRRDRVAYFNAKKFLCFQLAKILDTLQNPFRKSYQSLGHGEATQCAKGPYPIFDNVTALFAANPVIVRTATYIYACTEWVDDAFHGKEFLHEIYSRLLNPTSVSLANYIVDIEAGPYSAEYLAWNFNSGMAAIDGILANIIKRDDILIVGRNVYGGVHQLLHDYYAREDKYNLALEWFDGCEGNQFEAFLNQVKSSHADRIQAGADIHVYLESPSNPFGYVVDLPAICKIAHRENLLVIHDATVATPFLNKPLQREDKEERPDFVVHSYTKDLTGNGNATAGVVIGENHRMFLPKGDSYAGIHWDQTLFWGVYYIKGAFLDADKAFEVISGIKTLHLRMAQKTINTLVMAKFFNSHPMIRVHCNAIANHPNHELLQKVHRFGLPAPLFTIDMEEAHLSSHAFMAFFDHLSPGLDHQVSLGQTNTVVLCPAFTSHSELDSDALAKAGIHRTTIRIAVGLEDPRETLAHFVQALRLGIDQEIPGFSQGFMATSEVDRLFEETYTSVHQQIMMSGKSMQSLLS